MNAEQKAYLRAIYYDPSHPASYSGLNKLYREVKREGRYEIKRKLLKEWLTSQETYGLHHQARRRFKRPRVMVAGVGIQADSDLMDLSLYHHYNSGIRYVLVVIDDFSRHVWTRPLKNKNGKEVAKAFKDLFQEGFKTLKLRSDAGSEYTNQIVQKLFADEGIHHFTTFNETKANIAERVIKTLKSKYFRYMTEHQTFRYIDILDDVTHAYNHSYHRTIKMRPVDVTKENQAQVRNNIYGRTKGIKMKPYRYSIGDWVRISYLKRTFQREYSEKWSRELFKVVKRARMQGKSMYTLEDFAGDSVDGRFYGEELQPVTVGEDEIYKIEKVIKERKPRGRPKEYLVRWLGWPAKYDSWISEAELKDIRGEAAAR